MCAWSVASRPLHPSTPTSTVHQDSEIETALDKIISESHKPTTRNLNIYWITWGNFSGRSRNESSRTKHRTVTTTRACISERRRKALTPCLGKLFILALLLAASRGLLLVEVDLLFVEARLLLRRVGLLLVQRSFLLARGSFLLFGWRCVLRSARAPPFEKCMYSLMVCYSQKNVRDLCGDLLHGLLRI